ncbi:MAG: OmpA family protein [Bdellovibrionota bacterium]|jgi:outer membrane protein OmpA-like peptidoglycan-associated protein
MKKLVVFLFCFSLMACENGQMGATEGGALTGGALGAGLGAIIGHETGHTGAGVAIGAASGALGGALVGSQYDRQNRELAEMDARISARDQMLEENRRMINELRRRGADVRTTQRGVVVNLPDVLFEFNRADLRPDAVRAVSEIARVVNDYPNRTISVEGHADSVGSIAYNQILSERRATAVASELVRNSVSDTRIRSVGFGESRPIATNRTDEGRARNRRVEVIIEN